MTPGYRRRLRSQVCGWDFSMMRSVSGRTKTIRSRIGSKGIVITSTMTRSSSTSAMPPRDPAGARSTDSVNSTRSPIAMSSIVAIPSSVELGVGGDQSRCCPFIRVVPCGENWSRSPVDSHIDEDAIADRDPGAMDFCNWRHRYGLSNAIPYLIRIIGIDVKNTPPFRSMSIGSKDPRQLDFLVPKIRSTWKRRPASWWPLHTADARERRRTCVQHRSILRVSNHTKVGRPR